MRTDIMYFPNKESREQCIDNLGLARPEESVKFKECSDDQVKYGGHDDPRNDLVIGNTYIVVDVYIGSWWTEYELKGFEGKGFNSVCFERVEP